MLRARSQRVAMQPAAALCGLKSVRRGAVVGGRRQGCGMHAWAPMANNCGECGTLPDTVPQLHDLHRITQHKQ